MDCRSLLWTVLLFNFIPEFLSENCNKQRKCKTSRVLGLKTSDCYRMDWKEFPKCLPSDVEVIELSYNRIRKLNNADLQRYPYASHLYLMDNLLVSLDDELFKDMANLETLDLSVNALGKIPPAIFHLPKLKTLYLSQNWNINIAESIEDAKPISQSSLTKLDISYITEEGASADFPDFGDLPYLAFLNISGDQFNYLSTRHFAGLCNLQILVNVNVTSEYEQDCDCWKINQWLQQRKVQFTNLMCPISERECLDQEIDPEDLKVYQTCREKFAEIERSILLGKVGIGIGIAVGLILLLIAIFVYKRWRKNTRQRKFRENKNNIQQLDSLQFLNKKTKV